MSRKCVLMSNILQGAQSDLRVFSTEYREQLRKNDLAIAETEKLVRYHVSSQKLCLCLSSLVMANLCKQQLWLLQRRELS